MMFKRVFVTSIAIALVAFHAYGQNKSDKPEWITGVVVAYDDIEASTLCDRGCDRDFIVRLNSENSQESQYVRVVVKIKAGQNFPRELITRKRMWRFKVIRTPTLDELVYEYIVQNATQVAGERKWPIWKLLPGAESEKLPFNERLASYSTTTNGFKPLSD